MPGKKPLIYDMCVLILIVFATVWEACAAGGVCEVCVPGTVAALIGLQSTKTSGRLVRAEAGVCKRIDRDRERGAKRERK